MPTGASIFVNDEPASRGQTPLQIRMPPGTHAVRFELAGRPPLVRLIAVEAGRPTATVAELGPSQTPVVPVAPVAQVSPVSPIVTSTADVAPQTPPWRRPLGWGCVAGAGVSLGVGVWSMIQASDTQTETGKLLPRETDRRSSLEADLSTQQTIAWIGFGSALALGGAGAWLLLWPRPTQSGVTLLPSPGGLTASGSF